MRAEADNTEAAASCSESRLRAAMAGRGVQPAQLRQAIGAVEALLDEARRELAAKELRARRAAFEQLHAAMEPGDEQGALEEALAAARSAGVDGADLRKGEARLAELLALTPEERAARASRKREAETKKEAFLLVKRDDATGLEALLNRLGEDVRWQDWRDYAGRSLWQCSQELRASRVQQPLSARLGIQAQPSPAASAAAAAGVPGGRGPGEPPAPPMKAAPSAPPAMLPRAGPERLREVGAAAKEDPPLHNGQTPPQTLAADEEERLKARALRAVVQDDCAALGEVLERAPTEVLTRWQNKAGKDLLTLSEERGSSSAYLVLAKALGIMKEMKREAFEEREAVWVYLPGDVQPRRATVLEDTPEEADLVLLEYWDGNEPPERVERCLVRQMWS